MIDQNKRKELAELRRHILELAEIRQHLLKLQTIIDDILRGMDAMELAEKESNFEADYQTDPFLTMETKAVFTLLIDRIRRDYY